MAKYVKKGTLSAHGDMNADNPRVHFSAYAILYLYTYVGCKSGIVNEICSDCSRVKESACDYRNIEMTLSTSKFTTHHLLRTCVCNS